MSNNTNKCKRIFLVVCINFFIFLTVNLIFNIKYEQVDDFIIYSLYSGLDGTNNFHAIYMHPLLCIVIGIFYKMIPIINWHTVFLLSMQFICFALIGYTILKKHYTGVSFILYTLFASVFYTSLLMLIQYTSVAALLMMTAFVLVIDILETNQDKNSKLKTFTIFALYTIGVMTRIQSLLIIVPFYAVYLLIFLIRYKNKIIDKEKISRLIKYYLIMILIALIVYISNFLIYNSNKLYKEYNEWNKLRTTMQDIIYIDYENNREIYEQVGWSKNDFVLFRTFGFGDENIFSKDNFKEIIDGKMNNDNLYNSINTNLVIVIYETYCFLINNCTFILILFYGVYILNVFRKNKIKENTLIFITTILINAVFTMLDRNMFRVVIPEYILGTALLLYNLNLNKEEKIGSETKNYIAIVAMIILICTIVGKEYEYNYKLEDYESYRQIIDYTNNDKDNVYLYTIPSLQYRYLSYSVYKMPPKESFSNLRSIGGWDMFTQNYYDFKERNNLEGTFLDLLKENVYLIDGDTIWSGQRHNNYKEQIALAIKEHYGIEVEFEEIKQFDNLKIYKAVYALEE